MNRLLRRNGTRLSPEEVEQINQAKAREFKVPPMKGEELKDSTFFLLYGDKEILAMGQISLIEPVNFENQPFSIWGIGGIIANEKSKGYGRQMMTAIKDYLISNDLTGVGFCAMRNRGFYEKCDFKVDINLIERFVFTKGNKKITNTEDDCVLYIDSSDKFIERVLSHPEKKVILSRPPDW